MPSLFKYGNVSAWSSAQTCHYSHNKSGWLVGGVGGGGGGVVVNLKNPYSRFVAVHVFS